MKKSLLLLILLFYSGPLNAILGAGEFYAAKFEVRILSFDNNVPIIRQLIIFSPYTAVPQEKIIQECQDNGYELIKVLEQRKIAETLIMCADHYERFFQK